MKKVIGLLLGAALALAMSAPAALAGSVKNPAAANAFNQQTDLPKATTRMGVPPDDSKAKRKIGVPPDDGKAKMGAPIEERSAARGSQKSGGPIIDRGGPKSGGPIMDKGPGSSAAAKGLLPAVQNPSTKQR
jgi:hypothetical protein